MKNANTLFLALLAVGLWVSGLALTSYPTLSLGLILAGFVAGCTTVLVNEIREAKKEIVERMERRSSSQ